MIGATVCLSGCGPMHPGAAATVGSTRISVAELNAAVAHDTAAAPATTPAGRTAAVQASLTTIIQKDLITDAAKATGVTVSEAEVQAFLADQRKTNGTDEATAQVNNIPFADLHEVVYLSVLQSKLAAAVAGKVTDKTQQGVLFRDYIAKLALKEGVSINPRYGTWQADKFDVVPSNAFSSTQPVASAPVS
jgi:ATP-dependent protease HslVU (ClpYQ) ATPase subunit